MKRKDFLKGAGLAGLGLALSNSQGIARTNRQSALNGDCTLIPTETAGPFPLDLTENSTFFRQDIRESEKGVQLNLRLRIMGMNNCEPMENLRVNIWHCDKDGVYSGYNTGNNPGDANGIQLRGYQFTDVNGEVEFITVFPGWYNGRICHIHFQVYVSSSYAAISQLTFPLDAKNELYTNNSSLYTKGKDPLSFGQDNIFSDGHDSQLATLEPNSTTGGYNSFLEVNVEGTGTVGVGHLERETAKVFELGQNFPNPYIDRTTVPVNLKQTSKVTLEIWDLAGKKVATVFDQKKGPGKFEIEINPHQLGLANGNYMYQLVADTGSGIYRLPRMMTFQG